MTDLKGGMRRPDCIILFLSSGVQAGLTVEWSDVERDERINM